MAGYPENSTYHISTEEIIDICKRQGLAFEASLETSVAANGLLKTVFVTSDKPVIFYSRKVSYDGEGLNGYVYRDPVFTGGTETIEITNPNDINPQANESIFLSGATVSNDGVLSRARVPVFANTSVQGKGESLEIIDDPQIIPPNSNTLFVIENRDINNPQTIASIVQWVEPTRIPGIILNSDGTFNRYNGKLL